MFRSRVLIASAAAVFVLALAPLHPALAQAPATASNRAAAVHDPVPPDFRAQSEDWVSANQGFVLGKASCGTSDCATVIGTFDAGATWSLLSAFHAPVTLSRPAGVSEIRFADPLHGWAFDPGLWQTIDGGVTWARVTPPGPRPVAALAADPQAVYAVIS